MIIPHNKEQVTTSGDFKGVQFDIDEKGKAHIFAILRDSLYTNKPLAVIREISANAFDANVEAGNSSLPIEVSLPNVLEPVLKVRDFGLGLDEDDIQNIYCKYGASTKRSSNEYIGALGIGAKSPFCYGENFVIISRCDGKKATYNAYLDDTNIGRIAKLAEEDCDEPSGVEIQVPVKNADINLFASIAAHLFTYFPVKPTIKGRPGFTFPVIAELFKGDGWRLTSSSSSCVAVMGNIGYPIDFSALTASPSEQWMRSFIEKSFVINFPIGSVEVAANREGLQYTDFTIRAIKNKLEEVKNSLTSKIQKEFDSCASMYEAKMVHERIYDFNSPLRGLAQLVTPFIQFKGKKISGNKYEIGYDSKRLNGFEVHFWREYSVGHKAESNHSTSIPCSKLIPIVINDDLTIDKHINRIAPIVNRDANKLGFKATSVYLITIYDRVLYDKWATDNFFDAPTTNLKDLPVVKLSEIYPVAATEKNQKHLTKAFTLDVDGRHRNYSYPMSGYFKISDVDLKDGKGVYIIIDRFIAEVPNKYIAVCDGHPNRIINTIKEICSYTGSVMPTVYAIKRKESSSVGAGFVCLFEWMKKEVENYAVKEKLIQVSTDRREFLKSHNPMVAALTKMEFDNKTDIGAMCESFSLMEHANLAKECDKVLVLAQKFSIPLSSANPKFDLGSLIDGVKKKYPMLVLCQSAFNWQFNQQQADSIREYVKDVDLKNKALLAVAPGKKQG